MSHLSRESLNERDDDIHDLAMLTKNKNVLDLKENTPLDLESTLDRPKKYKDRPFLDVSEIDSSSRRMLPKPEHPMVF